MMFDDDIGVGRCMDNNNNKVWQINHEYDFRYW